MINTGKCFWLKQKLLKHWSSTQHWDIIKTIISSQPYSEWAVHCQCVTPHVYLNSVPWHTSKHPQKLGVCMQTHTRALPEAILPAHFHPTAIGIFWKSKPIDNLLQSYKKSIANFFALITIWTFNIRPVATKCVPQAKIPIGPHEY